MNYYDENDDRPRLYGGVAAAAYIIVMAADAYTKNPVAEDSEKILVVARECGKEIHV